MSRDATPADVLSGAARWCVVEGDALALLASLPDGCVDAVVTDPPYASTGDAASVMQARDGVMLVPREVQFYEAWAREHLRAWVRVMRDDGAAWFTCDWRGAMVFDHAAQKPVPLYERALDVVTDAPTHERAPVVLDPFAGSGTTGEAALALGILVRVGHYGPAATITGKRDARGRLLAAIDGKAPPDYLGILRGGRALVVEAKRRTGRLRRDDSREGIPAHQAAWLDAADRCGALALVVVEFVRAAGATRYAVPWGEIPWEGDSVGPSALAPWRVQGELYLARWTSGPSVASGRPQGAVPAPRGGVL